ncbi:MAG: hypothetical protein ACK2U9_12475, partial [Anaerolineae bacterium]
PALGVLVGVAVWTGVAVFGVGVAVPVPPDSEVVAGLGVARRVGVASRVARGVGVATMINGVSVGCTSVASCAPGVAVTTIIHGVCVAGGWVGTGVPLHPARTPTSIAITASHGRDAFMV